MMMVLRGALILGGLVFAIVGAGFMMDPASAGAGFGLIADGNQGLSSIRADLTAFFWVASGCMVWGAWARHGDPLLIAAALFAIALIGRIVNLIQHGSYDGWLTPMAIEAVSVTLCLIGSRVLPHRALS